jgi:hypothetical protein
MEQAYGNDHAGTAIFNEERIYHYAQSKLWLTTQNVIHPLKGVVRFVIKTIDQFLNDILSNNRRISGRCEKTCIYEFDKVELISSALLITGFNIIVPDASFFSGDIIL